MIGAVLATEDIAEHVEEKQRISRGIAPVAGLNFIEASTSKTSPAILAKNVQSKSVRDRVNPISTTSPTLS